MPETNNALQIPNNRELIAKTVAVWVLVSTVLVTLIAIILIWSDDDNKEKWASVKDVFAIVFPLWGTWIGTVLAYYFSKDNFAAANQSVKDMVSVVTGDQKLKSIPCK